jgi:hypothetical protein
MGKQAQERPGAGHPTGAQHTVSGNVSALHTKSVPGAESSHEQPRPRMSAGSAQRVRLSPLNLAQKPPHCVVTQAPSVPALPVAVRASRTATQRSSCDVAQPSAATRVLVHASSRQHASTSRWHRVAMHVPHSLVPPAKAQCSPKSSGDTKRMQPAERPRATARVTSLAARGISATVPQTLDGCRRSASSG